MLTVQLLENEDTIKPNDWCRPLFLITMSGGMSDSMSFKSCYGGIPENNVEWCKVKHVFGKPWFGSTVAEVKNMMQEEYEFIRGDIPKSHALNMKGYTKLNEL
jgi:hypothetical protein